MFGLSSFDAALFSSLTPDLLVTSMYDDAALAQWLNTQCCYAANATIRLVRFWTALFLCRLRLSLALARGNHDGAPDLKVRGPE
jgi:hypothetical protein